MQIVCLCDVKTFITLIIHCWDIPFFYFESAVIILLPGKMTFLKYTIFYASVHKLPEKSQWNALKGTPNTEKWDWLHDSHKAQFVLIKSALPNKGCRFWLGVGIALYCFTALHFLLKCYFEDS